MTPKQIIEECERAEREERPGCHCVHGHIDCSFRTDGPCADEAAHVLATEESADAIPAALAARKG